MSNYISVLSRTFAQALFLASVIALALGINYLSAWTGPISLPTGNNTPAPLNVGTTNQVKDGNLSVGASANSNTTIGLSTYGANVVKGWQTIGGVTAPTQLLELKGTAGTDGIKFPDGTVQTSAAVSTPSVTTGTFGGSAVVTLPGTFNVIEIRGLNGAPNGSSTNVLTVFFLTVYNSGGTWKYTALFGGAGTAYTGTSGTLASGVQQCPMSGSTYTVQFCLTRTAGGSLQINTGAATSQGAAFAYVMQ